MISEKAAVKAMTQREKYQNICRAWVREVDTLTPYSIGQWIDSNALDIDYVINRNGEYHSAIITVTLGGPTVEIDTGDKAVNLYWAGEEASYSLDYGPSQILNAYLGDIYNAEREM
jgi:hypothetical protein